MHRQPLRSEMPDRHGRRLDRHGVTIQTPSFPRKRESRSRGASLDPRFRGDDVCRGGGERLHHGRLFIRLAAFFLLLPALTCAQPKSSALPPPTASSTSPPAASSALQPPTTTNSPAHTEIRAELVAREFTTLASEMGARILKSPLREGESFKSGDTLFVLDCTVQYAKLKLAQAVLQAEIDKTAVLSRLDRLNVTSKMELAVSQAEQAKARSELAIKQAEMSYCKIAAPYSGQVVRLLVREYQYVKPGQDLVDIHNPEVLELIINMPSVWMQKVRRGDRILIRVDETSRSYPAKIIAFGAKIDAVSQLVKVVAEIVGNFPDLSPGMSGQVQLNIAQ